MRICSAMVSSRWVRGSLTPFTEWSAFWRAVTQSKASPMDLPVKAMMFMPPTVTARRGGLQSVAFAVGAGVRGHVAFDLSPDPVGLSFGEAAFEVGDDALEGGLPLPDLALLVGVAHGHGVALGAVENYAYVLFLELPHRDPGGEAVSTGHGLDHAGVPGAHCAGAGPGLEGAFGEGEGLVGKDEVGVNLHPGSESRALGASAVRAVEGEGAGLDLSEADAAVYAGEVLGVEGLCAIDDADQDDAVSELQGKSRRESARREASPSLSPTTRRVYDDLDGVFSSSCRG